LLDRENSFNLYGDVEQGFAQDRWRARLRLFPGPGDLVPSKTPAQEAVFAQFPVQTPQALWGRPKRVTALNLRVQKSVRIPAKVTTHSA